MSFFDKIKDKLIPEPSKVPMSTSASGGIGNRRGALGFEDDVGNLFALWFALLVSRRKRVALLSTALNPSLRNHVHLLTSCP
jgi:hypothetical protein